MLPTRSRNQRLTAENREVAPQLYRALREGAAKIGGGPAAAREAALEVLRRTPRMRVEYLEVVDSRTMRPVERVTSEVRIAAAVWLGDVRLIDNVAVTAT